MTSATGPTYRFSLWNLILKDFRIQYRNMSLGVMWSVLNPLIMLGTMLVVFTHIHKNDTIDHFGIFLLLGLIQYNFFSLCINIATGSLIQNTQILKKLQFPRVIIPIASVLSQVIHLLIQLGLLAIFLMMYRIPVTVFFLWLPLILMIQLVFIMGLGLICSILDVYFRDTQYVVQSILTVLFWFTPIFYPSSMAAENLPRPLYLLFMANPLAGCIESARSVVLHNRHPDGILIIYTAIAALVSFSVGLFLFRRLQDNLADHL
jgi:lipopolysaccharide transport system permease protein